MSSFESAHDLILNDCTINTVGRDATFNSFANNGPLLVNVFVQHMTGSLLPPEFQKKLEKHILGQNISKLPCANAAYNDYTTQDKRRVACFEGTREVLLEEIAKWILTLTGPRLYVLWGIAGVGKSTVAQTVAERVDNLRRLGASFFFSRNEVDRKNARIFFTTIAFHLCVFSEDFARAIEEALLTQRGRGAISKEPLEQLDALILEPLRNFNHRDIIPIVIVIDALDECDDEDGSTIFIGLTRLVRKLPFFKVILTTRPQPHLQHLIQNPNIQTEFHLQNIEDKIVDNDIRHYLEHRLSPEQVRERLPGLRIQWSASHQEVLSLVRAVGRLFIIASTAVLFILDKAARNPSFRMKTLQDHFVQNRTPFDALNEFYTVILRSAVPEGCQRDIVEQYQFVVGTIVLVQDALSVNHLSALICLPEESVYAVLDNLQSVISVSEKNIPRVYHKSFLDYLTDDTRCKDDNLRIVPRAHHTRIAVCCVQLMNKQLKQNVLGIATHECFNQNDDRLQEENISMEQLMEKIPGDLKYSCIYWANHVEGADTENVNLAKEVETFVMVHLLHWLEALSWINRMDMAYPAVRVLSKYMKPAFDTDKIISDALRFIARFSEQIRRSALYTYYCALPFMPSNCPLYKVYSKDMLCQLEGIPTQWDALMASFEGEGLIFSLIFSHDSSKFASTHYSKMMLRDGESGTLIRTYKGDTKTIAHDFCMAAVSNGCAVTLWSMKNHAPIATVTPPKGVVSLALSFDGARLAVALVDGAVGLWDSRNAKLIASLEGYVRTERYGDEVSLRFAPRGYRLAFISDDDGTIRLWNGDDGRLISRLDYKSKKHGKIVFSSDGRRLASLTRDRGLTLWDGEKGVLVDAARNVGNKLAISEDGSFIATGGWETVQLWGGNPLSVVDTLDIYARDLAISCDILAIASFDIKLYDVNNHAVVATLNLRELNANPRCLALSPDCTRLVVEYEAVSQLYDVALLKASTPAPKRQYKSQISALAFLPDSSRLASGLTDGTIELWDTNFADQPIAAHKLHSSGITALAFALDGEQFVSGSTDNTIRFWGGNDGTPMERTYFFSNAITSVAFSPDLLAIATSSAIVLFTHGSLLRNDTLEDGAGSLTFSGGGALLASASDDNVTVWNVAERAAIATFAAKLRTDRLTFSPDDSQLAIRSMYECEGYELFDIVNMHPIELMGYGHPSWIPGVMNGLLCCYVPESRCLIGQPSRNEDPIGLLWIPEDFDVQEIEFGSSIVALGCLDGRILFVRFPTTGIH